MLPGRHGHLGRGRHLRGVGEGEGSARSRWSTADPAEFVEKDEGAHRFVVEAKGKDKRGDGTAGALVTSRWPPGGTGTDVEVLTDLAITGKPAQFGRGVVQDVSDKLARAVRRVPGAAALGCGRLPLTRGAVSRQPTPSRRRLPAHRRPRGGGEQATEPASRTVGGSPPLPGARRGLRRPGRGRRPGAAQVVRQRRRRGRGRAGAGLVDRASSGVVRHTRGVSAGGAPLV